MLVLYLDNPNPLSSHLFPLPLKRHRQCGLVCVEEDSAMSDDGMPSEGWLAIGDGYEILNSEHWQRVECSSMAPFIVVFIQCPNCKGVGEDGGCDDWQCQNGYRELNCPSEHLAAAWYAPHCGEEVCDHAGCHHGFLPIAPDHRRLKPGKCKTG